MGAELGDDPNTVPPCRPDDGDDSDNFMLIDMKEQLDDMQTTLRQIRKDAKAKLSAKRRQGDDVAKASLQRFLATNVDQIAQQIAGAQQSIEEMAELMGEQLDYMTQSSTDEEDDEEP